MNSPMEDRLREALAEAGATVDTSTLRPLQSSGRPRVRVDFRLLAAAGAVVLAGTVTAAVLIAPGDERRAAVANPPVDQKYADASVFLCGKLSPSRTCPGGSVTAEQTKAIVRALREGPGVEQVLYVSQDQAYASFRRDYADDKALLGTIDVTDLPPSFQIKLKPGADPKVSLVRMKSMEGVGDITFPAEAVKEMGPEWEKNADVSVFLCGEQSSLASCGAVAAPDSTSSAPRFVKYGKAITPAQRRALGKEIGAIPGVQSTHFESQQQAYENFQRSYKDNKALAQATKKSDMPESFRLELRPDADWDKVITKLKGLPGVATVVNGKCMIEQFMLRTHYGISASMGKGCAPQPG
ncbi:permease-like cell division protein FtsX [Nonomuraea sp. NEAU-A123]|uniref:permease-like cell division protein FtsX n=1 Tax=Nonomuraea sp. NEAU-A123 TaxID=2839649 RepID=UPI001BE45B40|nr:permease-like cell division protein FtsX [Nonomuraea sp. NEAU-A123]MBT2233190.1 permease-like cell division protein FtsX [Nonomuraea sp. NEAU-A123]